MVKKDYAWTSGAKLDEHSRRKHKVVREYFTRYLAVRCQMPVQSRFRLAVVDGFAGAGVYDDGSPGSPIIFIQELRTAVEVFNLRRRSEGMAPLNIECLLLLNDYDPDAVSLLKENVSSLEADIKENVRQLHLRIEYFNERFELAYAEIKDRLIRGRYSNVLFNLDQCGYSHVEFKTLADIMQSFASAEVFYTFVISSLLAFLRKDDARLLTERLRPLGVGAHQLAALDGMMNNSKWLATAERIVFDAFRNCAPYVSPFSINNPDGWRYWLIHFANSYRARQEYNNVLHDNKTAQAHFGRSGLDMLAYDQAHEGALYLFDDQGRQQAIRELHDDIPRVVGDFGDAISLLELYRSIYNKTPAHMDDIHAVMIENHDLEVITSNGASRRKPKSIRAEDIVRLKRQRTFPNFFGANDGKKK
ncbi:three-Cys-motif partner protein TcmP [Bradyrhizobium sp. Tv2a-2]|uniref:three-Cys-motif partner protein TcmP n=1 Tax=Bradyrhizobium sp. Tv2a-2 TaxID=113395 RepID=UPI000429E0C2|nr:three-Cys-motif partner protein TcmP [Bradyrhizobium sp. Tv2a-2]